MKKFWNWLCLMPSRFWNWIKNHLFDGFLYYLVGELFEEAIESAIAYFITIAIIETAAKVVTVVTITQGLKTAGKRILFPYIKQLTYREGKDKMNALKNYWDKVVGNKVTGTIGGAGFAITAYYALAGVITQTWLYWLTVALSFVIAYNIAIFFGGETLEQIRKRWADKELTDHQKKVVAEAQKRIDAAAKAATASEEQKAKDEEKKKKEEAFEAEVQQAMRDLEKKEIKK